MSLPAAIDCRDFSQEQSITRHGPDSRQRSALAGLPPEIKALSQLAPVS